MYLVIFKFFIYLLRTLAEMAEKEQQIKLLKTDVLEKERKITGEEKSSGINFTQVLCSFYCFCHTHLCIWCNVYYKTSFCFVPGLENDRRRQEEQIHEMEENISILRKELSKTEQARKDTSIKVRSTFTQTYQSISNHSVIIKQKVII